MDAPTFKPLVRTAGGTNAPRPRFHAAIRTVRVATPCHAKSVPEMMFSSFAGLEAEGKNAFFGLVPGVSAIALA